MKKLLVLLAVFTSISFMAVPVASAQTGGNNPLDKACQQLTPDERKSSSACRATVCNEMSAEAKRDNPGCKDVDDPLTGNNGLIVRIARGVGLVAGMIAVIVIIVAGITMATSSGDSQSFKTARNAVIYSAVGLLLIVAAQAIIALVISGV